MDVVWPYLAALVPTIFVATFFYVIMKRIIEGDRNERLAQRRFEQAEDAAENVSEKERDEPGPEVPPRTGD